MIKKAVFFILFLSAIFAGTNLNANPSRIESNDLKIQKIDCCNYFEVIVIGDKKYLIEYNDTDGSIVSVIVIDE